MNAPTPTLARPTCSPQGRITRTCRALAMGVAVTAAAVVGIVALTGDEASAVQGALPTNAMAPIVTSSASQALASYDEWIATSDPVDYRSYVWFRTQTAQYAAEELGYAQLDMVTAWADTSIEHQRAVLAAMSQVGVPYRTNTSQEGVGFDCSGLTTYAWSRAGVQLVRQSGAQIQNADRLDRSTARAGDLVQYPGHVMMYLGVGDAIIHSVMRGRTVEIDTISDRRANSVRFGDPTG